MERSFHFFHYKQALLHYSVFGTGTKPMLCFHGFGLTGTSLFELENTLSQEYTFYNFDLFSHGQSEWTEENDPVSQEFLAALITEFNKEKNISSFSLLGYSIGAKIGWTIASKLPDKVKEITAIAPDGLFPSFWYRFATGSVLSRTLFKLLLSNSTLISTFLPVGKFLKLAPSIVIRFAESQLRTGEQRTRVYKTWIIFRNLNPDLKRLAQTINKNNINLTIYLGAHDKIITYKKIKKFVDLVTKKNIITLEAGHSNLIPKVVDSINFLKSPNTHQS